MKWITNIKLIIQIYFKTIDNKFVTIIEYKVKIIL